MELLNSLLLQIGFAAVLLAIAARIFPRFVFIFDTMQPASNQSPNHWCPDDDPLPDEDDDDFSDYFDDYPEDDPYGDPVLKEHRRIYHAKYSEN